MTLPIGTPLWKRPTVITDGAASGTLCTAPASTTDADSEFVGVTVRQNEDSTSELRTQRGGDILSRVQGPCRVNDLACFSAGQTCLAVNNGKTAVGRTLQSITGSGIELIAVRTGSPGGGGATTSTHPFQVNKLSDSTVSVSALSFCLKGLNSKEIIEIAGVGEEFTVLKDSVIYLEILFDVNRAPFLASICVASDWGGDFPRSIKTVRKADNASEIAGIPAAFALHVGITSDELATQITLAEAKLALFASQTDTVKQWAAYVPIAFGTESSVEGLAMLDGSTPFVLYQSLKTNLMLASFCDSNVPCVYPIASGSPIVDQAPEVAFAGSSSISMSVPGYASAVIFYTLDGSDPSASSTRYVTPISAPEPGGMLKAIGVVRGKFNSKIATFA